MLISEARLAIESLRDSERVTDALDGHSGSTKFSVFEAFEPGENALSRMLAYLFHPQQSHGQAGLFLNAFLRLIGMEPPDGPVGVRTEYACEGISDPRGGKRRIDIVIQLGQVHIGIECKPWAAEQEAQCGDYARELDLISRNNWRLVFLTRDGRPPSTMSSAQLQQYGNRVVPLRFDQLAKAFQDCQITDPAVAEFVVQFHRHVVGRINGETFMTAETRELLDELFTEGNIALTGELLALSDEIRKRMIAALQEDMLSRLRSEYPEGDWRSDLLSGGFPASTVENFDELYSGLYFYKPGWEKRFAIGFSNQHSRGQSMYFGIYDWGRKAAQQYSDGVRSKLNEPFSVRSHGTLYWLWGDYLTKLGHREYGNWYDAHVVRQMMRPRVMTEALYPLLKTTIELSSAYVDSQT